ncbi:peptidoglycan recognition protein family protein [Streptomyces sp. NPDC001002]
MRGFLASSVGVACAAALALPLTPPAAAAAASPASSRTASMPADRSAGLSGGTQSLPLAPLARARVLGAAAPEQGLARRDVRHFSMVGVIWDDPDTALHGSVQVRTRATGSGTWSDWQSLGTHSDDAPDPDSAERASGRVHGSTPPLWVGDSDGVEVRVRAESASRTEDTARGTRTLTSATGLPTGLRLELVDPGEPAESAGPEPVTRARSLRTGTGTPESTDSQAATELPALDLRATEQEVQALYGSELTRSQRVKPYIGPRPRIVTRRGWGADEKLREKKFVYTRKVKAAFVHHTDTGNGYKCSQAASVIRGIYRYHVKSMGWRDIGYNFLVDKCGTIYEGRAGGVAKPVLGAHTLGFNTKSMGIAVLGSFGSAKPPAAAVNAIARLTAWKLGIWGGNPKGKTYLKSGGGNLYRKGKNVRLNVISGHRDGFATDCPGLQLYRKLGTTRTTAARFQGR